MVSGSKKDSRTKKKGKEKLVFAKDKKQAIIAISIFALMLLNGLRMGIMAIIANNTPPPQQQVESPAQKSEDPTQLSKNGQSKQPTPADQATQTSPQSLPQPAPSSPFSGGTVLPLVILALAIIGGVAYFVISSVKEKNSPSAGGSTKGGKKKGSDKFTFAKDKNQAILAVVVFSIFILNGLRMGVMYVMETYFPPRPTTAAGESPQPDDLLSKQNPNSADPNSINPANPGGVNPQNTAQDANNIYTQTVSLQKNGLTKTAQTKQNSDDNVEILAKRRSNSSYNGKMVMIDVGNSGRSNPFLPAAENYVPSKKSAAAFLPPPPETTPTDSDAGKVMATTISGILYDQFSPSAIINIQGTDYLVKRGDIINHYKVLSITKNDVIVQLGQNIYRAGVGQLLSLTSLNANTIANLDNKFGGNIGSKKVKQITKKTKKKRY